MLAGTVTILRTGLNRRTDFSSLFGRAAEPSRTVANPTGLLAGLQFDVQIETAQGVSFQTSLAQNLQADANLRLRGTLSNPVLLGRINITQGEMTFFGNKYTITRGSVSFYNPVKLEPNLNLDLQTRARGIDITLSVSGPINWAQRGTSRLDPPLQGFPDIVAFGGPVARLPPIRRYWRARPAPRNPGSRRALRRWLGKLSRAPEDPAASSASLE